MPKNALQIVDPTSGGEIPDNPLLQGARAPVAHEQMIQPLRLSMPGGDASPRDALLDQFVKYWGAADQPPYNEGGQQINMFLPNGQISTANLPSHPMMVQAAGIPGSLEDFMRTTGAIRSHGPDNYDVRGMPTNNQIRSMSRYARDEGHSTVWVDAETPSGVVSDSVPVSRLGGFFRDAFGQ